MRGNEAGVEPYPQHPCSAYQAPAPQRLL